MRVLQQERKLVAAEAGRRVRRPQALLQAERDLDEQLVAGRVAEAVVDRLEVVEVEEQQGDVVAAAARPLERVLDAVQEQRPVRQPGERVVECLVRELVLEHAPLGHVVRREHDAAHRLVVQEVAEDALDRPEAAVCVPQPQLPLHLGLRRDGVAASSATSSALVGVEQPFEAACPISDAGSWPSIASTEGVT